MLSQVQSGLQPCTFSAQRAALASWACRECSSVAAPCLLGWCGRDASLPLAMHMRRHACVCVHHSTVRTLLAAGVPACCRYAVGMLGWVAGPLLLTIFFLVVSSAAVWFTDPNWLRYSVGNAPAGSSHALPRKHAGCLLARLLPPPPRCLRLACSTAHRFRRRALLLLCRRAGPASCSQR